MDTLLLQLIGPMQSWGVQSRFGVRDTGLEPSKSGVIGLLCAALGRPRTAPVDDLVRLRMGVRVDREGQIAKDFHTALGVYRANGQVNASGAEISNRYYLMNAAFLVGLEGDLPTLETLQAALRSPVWSLYLGSKAFVPAAPVWLPDGLRKGEGLEEALRRYPWLCGDAAQRPTRLRVVLDDDQGEQVRPDVPVSFAERRFTSRRVHGTFFDIQEGACTSHN